MTTLKFYGMTPQDAVTCILGGAVRYNNGQSAAVVQGLHWAEQLAELLRMQSAWDAVGNKVSIKIADSNPAGTPGAKAASAPDLPPPFDSQEEAQRAAGIWPQEAEPATVRVKPSALDEMAAQAASWRDRWVAAGVKPAGQHVGITEAEFNAYMRIHGKQCERTVGASPALGAPYAVGVDLARDGADAMAYMLRSARKPTPAPTGIDATLTERGSRYGKFKDHAKITQDLKDVMRACPKWSALTPSQKEALEMVVHKIGRILNGDPNYDDSWVDVAGYSKLVADELQGVSR